MREQKVRHLPVVQSDEKMLGLIAEDDLLDGSQSEISDGKGCHHNNRGYPHRGSRALDA
jgi:CBS domain-containing protein